MDLLALELKKILKVDPTFWHEYFDKTLEYIKNDGLWLEFGVCTGSSINKISSKTKNMVYGFDSFYGLPENWGTHQPKGMYSTNGQLPPVNANVKLVVGMFQDTLDLFLSEHSSSIAYLHLDADLYSSTKYVLEKLESRIIPGTVISFDEIYNYSEYLHHELKAWVEYCERTKINYEWISRTIHEQASCIIK